MKARNVAFALIIESVIFTHEVWHYPPGFAYIGKVWQLLLVLNKDILVLGFELCPRSARLEYVQNRARCQVTSFNELAGKLCTILI